MVDEKTRVQELFSRMAVGAFTHDAGKIGKILHPHSIFPNGLLRCRLKLTSCDQQTYLNDFIASANHSQSSLSLNAAMTGFRRHEGAL